MLLLLLGIIVLHVAVLVLLFVSTIVSVSVRPGSARLGRPELAQSLASGPRFPPRPLKFADCESQTSLGLLQFLAIRAFSVVFENIRVDSGVGRKQASAGLGQHTGLSLSQRM